MKNKSPLKVNANEMKEVQTKSPIVKAKNNPSSPKKDLSSKKALITPNKAKGMPKKEGTSKSPKQQNGMTQKDNVDVQNGTGKKNKPRKPIKTEMSEASDDSDSAEEKSVPKFTGTAAMDEDTVKPVKREEGNVKKESTQKKVKAKKIKKAPGSKEHKVSLMNTLAEFKKKNEIDKMRVLLPRMNQEIEKLKANKTSLTISAKRRLRMLICYRHLVE